MWTPFRQPIRKPLWIAGITLCLLAAMAIASIVGSTPASYAGIPDEDALSPAALRGSEDARGDDLQANVAIPQSAANRRNRAWCPTCGVVESIREIERSGEAGRQELTIRFRDGRAIVLDEASRRNWQSGNRVIVIGGLNVAVR